MALPVSTQRFEIGRTLNRTFSAIGGNFAVFFLLALSLAAVPIVLIGFGYGYLFQYLAIWAPSPVLFTLMPFALMAVQMIPAFVLMGALTQGSIVYYKGGRAQIGESFGTGIRFLLPLIGLGILTAIGLLLWFMLVVVPGLLIVGMISAGFVATAGGNFTFGALLGGVLAIIAFVPVALALIRWSVSAPSLVIENPGVMGAFRRSGDLTRGNRWKIFFIGLIYVVISFLIQLGLTFVSSSLLVGTLGSVDVAVWGLYGVQVLYSTINAMILASGQAALYYELRVSKEGATSDELAKVFE
jgi:hypothetical protein